MAEKDAFIIEKQEHWRALWHPLRIGILSHLSDRELTNEELAKLLGVKSGKLYHHTRVLFDAGLIVEAGTRQKGPITERLYKAAASSLAAADTANPLDKVEASLRSALMLFKATRDHNPSVEAVGQHLILEMDGAQIQELQRKFLQLAREAKAKSDPALRSSVSLAFLCHPLTVVPEKS